MSSGHQARSLYHEDTIQSADSIESHPNKTGLFALGTYQVDQHEEDQTKGEVDGLEEVVASTSPDYSRKGLLRLKRVNKLVDDFLSCDNLCEIETAAILDMKWLHPSSSLLSIALADSHVSLYSLQDSLSLTHVKTIKVNSTQALCLSLDWSDRIGGHSGGYDSSNSKYNIEQSNAIVSQSDGTLAHLSHLLSESSSIETWKAHDYEAWTTAYDCWSGANVLWSGGDDLSLKGWDIRTECIDEQRAATFTVKKCFEGGVTSMQSHHLRQHLWAIGSYDGQLRLFDARNIARPLSTTQAGGGIWRIKWHPTKANQVLLGCMHDGFKVMQLDSLLDANLTPPKEEMKLLTRFDEHKSLAYGCDWDRGESSDSNNLIYSCSFYDAVWHAWQCI